MKKQYVTQNTVLKAIQTEPLIRGLFVASCEDVPDKTACSVCALGAVLRHSGFKNSQIMNHALKLSKFGPSCEISAEREYVSVEEAIESLMKQRLWLNALSIKFEHISDQHGVGTKTRNLLCQFVKKNFPSRVSLKLDKKKKS